MYDNWIKVCNLNKSLKDKNFEFTNENEKLKAVVFNFKNLVKKNDKVQKLTAELESTKKKFEDVEFWYNKARSNSEYGII